jgi:hypothetical protein
VKVGAWSTVSTRRIVEPVFSTETIKCERYLRVEGQHFQRLLTFLNCNYFIPNVIGRQACRFIGKTRLPLAASGAPVAAKRREVELIKKVKIIPVYIYMENFVFTTIQVNAGIVLRLGNEYFLSNPFQLIIHQSSITF